jgi:hypothetical protein
MWLRLLLHCGCLLAGVMEILPGSVKTRKHSSILFLQVIAGSKVTFCSSSQAFLFLAFQFGVRESVLWCSTASGLYLGAKSLRCLVASSAHAWGFLQPPLLSWTHSMQMQAWDGICVASSLRSLSLLDVLIRLATVFVVCLLRRHFVAMFVSSLGFVPVWYHAGSPTCTPGERQIAARFVLYFFAVLSILRMFSFSIVACGPLAGGFHICRKVLTRATSDVPWGAAAIISKSVTIAHVCLVGVRFR